jgi:O-antigen ligase
MNPLPDELRDTWVSDSGEKRTDMRELIEQLEKKSRGFDRLVSRRDLRECLAGAAVAVLFLWFAARATNPVERAAHLWLAACGVWIVFFLLRYSRMSRKPAPEQTLEAYRQALVEKYDRQIRLLKNVKYWYILPLWLGQMLLCVDCLRRPHGVMTGLLVAALVTLVNAALWWLNEVAGVGYLRRQRAAARCDNDVHGQT